MPRGRVRPPRRQDAYLAARREVLARARGYCLYCGVRRRHLTADHLVPRSLGGSDRAENLAPACAPCNSLRGAWSIEVFFELLLAERGPEALLGIIDRCAVLEERAEKEKERLPPRLALRASPYTGPLARDLGPLAKVG